MASSTQLASKIALLKFHQAACARWVARPEGKLLLKPGPEKKSFKPGPGSVVSPTHSGSKFEFWRQIANFRKFRINVFWHNH